MLTKEAWAHMWADKTATVCLQNYVFTWKLLIIEYFETLISHDERKLAFMVHCCPKQALSKMHLWTRAGELSKIPSHQWLPSFFPNPHHQPLNPLAILLFFLPFFPISSPAEPSDLLFSLTVQGRPTIYIKRYQLIIFKPSRTNWIETYARE